MKNILVLISFISLQAFGITLYEVEKKFYSTHPVAQSIQEKKEAFKANIESRYSFSPITLSLDGARVYPDGDERDFEYSVGVSKEFLLPSQLNKNLFIASLKYKIYELSLQKELLSALNSFKYNYHKSCIYKQKVKSYQEIYNDFLTLYNKKKIAHRYDEVSKMELMQLNMKKNIIYQELLEVKSSYKESKIKLLNSIYLSEQNLECDDLYPIKDKVFMPSDAFKLSFGIEDLKVEVAKQETLLYDRNFESFELSLGYDKEIDTKRYGVGVSVPLNFTSKADEYKKIEALHNQKIAKLNKQHILLQKKAEFATLKERLKTLKELIDTTKKSLRKYQKELLPLVERSYQLGESSVVEYLLSKEEFFTTRKRLYEYKDSYYKTLFKLYTLLERDEI